MKILHLSHTQLVGAPGIVCKALNTQPGVEARWVVLRPENYGGLSFNIDWRWDNDKQQVLEFLAQADVIHLHNYIDLDCQDFEGIDFRSLWNQGKPLLRHFHSTPQLIARYMKRTEEDILACPIPKIVIAQYPERFFSNAKLVPNFVDFSKLPIRKETNNQILKIGYAPSVFRSAHDSRWDTKGYPETVRILESFQKIARKQGLNVEIDIIEQVAHEECLRRKSECDIFIDDLVTGSYHLNTLESLALGKATLCYLDSRVDSVVRSISECNDFPIVNVRLENLNEVLLSLVSRPDVVRSLGRNAYEWMQKNWDGAQLVHHYLDAYAHIQAAPHESFPERYDYENNALQWLALEFNDAIWRSRKHYWPKKMSRWMLLLRAAVRKVKNKIFSPESVV
jgi:hypothetical protein